MPRTTRRLAVAAAAVGRVLPLGAVVGAAPAAAANHSVNLRVNQADARSSELVLIRGRALRGGSAPGAVRVVLLLRKPGGALRPVQATRTGPAGRYSFRHRLAGNRQYRVRYEQPNGSLLARSGVVSVAGRSAPRTREERTAAWRDTLGSPATKPRTQRLHGASVRYRGWKNAVVAQVGANTSIVRGEILSAYRGAGTIRGRLGAPIGDENCQLLGTGCLQRFQNGAIYVDPAAPRRVTVVSGHPPKRASFIAVGRSQVGYVEPYYRGSKYNAWMGNSNAWCGYYQAWVGRASGNGAVFPRGRNFDAQVQTFTRKASRVGGPRVGAFVFFDYRGVGRPTHGGYVVGVNSNGTIQILEGNTGPSSARAVRESVRGTSQVHSYWMP